MAEQKTVPKKHASSTSQPCLYVLHIELKPNELGPTVWRRLEVDGRISLGKLHHFILYRHDLGDNWEHLITVEEIRDDLDNDQKCGAWV